MQYIRLLDTFGNTRAILMLMRVGTRLTTIRGEATEFVFQRLRNYKREPVIAQYSHGTTTQLNGAIMNLEKHFQAESALNAKPPKEADSRVFIAPSSDVLPDDGVFDYVEVSSVKGLVSEFQPNVVLMFKPENLRLVDMMMKYADIVGLTPVVMQGLPRSNYSAEWDDATFAAAKVAYQEAFDEAIATEKTREAIARSDRSEKGRSSRREGKYEDGGNKFSKFDVKPFGQSKNTTVETEDQDVGLGEA